MNLQRLCRGDIQHFLCLVLILSLVMATTPMPIQSAPKNETLPGDPGWPREVKKNGTKLIYYEPQLDDWKDFQELSGDIAVSLPLNGGRRVMGVATFTAKTDTDVDQRTVLIRDIQITGARFPSLDSATATQMETLLRQVFPTDAVTISMDRLMAGIKRSEAAFKPVAVKNDPPRIFVSKEQAILLLVDGEPVRTPIENSTMEFVVNTNWDLFYDKTGKQYYLLSDKTWLQASALDGTWAVTMVLPQDMTKLPPNQNWDDVRQAIPPTVSAIMRGPQVFYSNAPAEMILFRGEPAYTLIPGTQLSYATNTENDVFVEGGQTYTLISGRWFSAKTLDGPWSYAGNGLPSDFSQIPPDHIKSHVLASVPGTQEAQDAVILAELPNTVVVNRAEVEAKVKVSYAGDPQFKPIEDTSMQYAVNTQDKVIRDGDLYYLCFQGVWFMSTMPDGPWKTADSIPQNIYTIPPSSPVHNVTYVTVANPTPTTVESTSTAGYMGMFLVGAGVGLTIAYGTGYYYPPYYGWGPYPIYYPWPATYGVGAVWNPYTGGYWAGRAVYGPYGAAGGSAWYNPATGRYGRAASVQGWYGGRTAASVYNPWTGGYGATRQGHNAYSQWGSSVVGRGDDWARTGHVSNANGTIAGYQTSGGKSGVIARGNNGGAMAKTSGGDVYAGKDGNVYRKDSSGSWSKYDNGNWNSVNTDAAKNQAKQRAQNSGISKDSLSQARGNVSPDTMSKLNSQAQSRQFGSQQASRQHDWQRGGGWSGGGWSRGGGGGGGGFRGGGGRRR